MRTFSIMVISLLLFSFAFAHPGRTDSKGGHYNRKTGEYHYHNSDSKAKTAAASQTTVDSNSEDQEKAKEENTNTETIEKLQLEIKSLKTKMQMRDKLIERLKTTCLTLKKQNHAMKQLLTDANIPIPKIETITDGNDTIKEQEKILEPNSLPQAAKNEFTID
ncbi:MAG: YHYH domain-containing protein [Phycisphaerales bacterium]